MSKQAFLLEVEVPEGAIWKTDPAQVAYSLQGVVKTFLKAHAFPGSRDETIVTVRTFDWRYPDPRLEGKHACILYFETEKDLDEFEAMVHAAKPDMTVEKL